MIKNWSQGRPGNEATFGHYAGTIETYLLCACTIDHTRNSNVTTSGVRTGALWSMLPKQREQHGHLKKQLALENYNRCFNEILSV